MAPERLDHGQISVLVLAGGASTRMGSNKAIETIAGETLLSRVVRASAHLGPVTIVGGEASLLDYIDGEPSGTVSHRKDDVAGSGPLAGLVTALPLVRTPEVLLTSCDLAFPSSADFDLLISTRRAGDADIAVPLVGGQRQWHSVAVATRVAPLLASAFEAGTRSLVRGFDGCSQSVVTTSSLDFFRDVDTPEELSKARIGAGNRH